MKSSVSSRLGLIALVAAMTAGCTTGGAQPPTGSASPEPTGSSTVAPTPGASVARSQEPTPTASAAPRVSDLTVYLLIDRPNQIRSLVPVRRSVNVATATPEDALSLLLEGPSDAERSGRYEDRQGEFARLSTAIPQGTTLNEIAIDSSVATVDLSAEFARSRDDLTAAVLPVAQIVYTLTLFPDIRGVEFRVAGEPLPVLEGHEGSTVDGPATRDHYWDQLPPVFVDHPTWGGVVGDRVSVEGRVQIVQDAFRIALIDGRRGRVLDRLTIRSSGDAGSWLPPGGSTFDARLGLPEDIDVLDLRLRTWAGPATDSSGVLEYPISLRDGS